MVDAKNPGSGGLGVVLGGGGSRAFVHFGVIKRMEEAGLKPAMVSGSSMGAVLGALYAREPDLGKSLPPLLDYFRKSSLFGGLVKQEKGDGLHRRPGMIGGLARKMATASVAIAVSFRKGLRKVHPVNLVIDDFFGGENARVENLAIPFGLNAINLTRGTQEEITSGPLAPALKAGVAIGLIFAPHEWNGEQYADAAPVCPVPVGLCRRMGAGVVLAVDICAPLIRPMDSRSGFDVVRRIMSVQSELLNKAELAGADLVLKIDVSDVFWADFSRIDELVERGYRAADGIIDALRERLARF